MSRSSRYGSATVDGLGVADQLLRLGVRSASAAAVVLLLCGCAQAPAANVPAASTPAVATDLRPSYLTASQRFEDGLASAKGKFLSRSKGLADFDSGRSFYGDVGLVYSQFAIDVGLLGGDTPAVGDNRDVLLKAALAVSVQLLKMSQWTIDDFAKAASQDDLGPLLDKFRAAVRTYSADLGLSSTRPVVPSTSPT